MSKSTNCEANSNEQQKYINFHQTENEQRNLIESNSMKEVNRNTLDKRLKLVQRVLVVVLIVLACFALGLWSVHNITTLMVHMEGGQCGSNHTTVQQKRQFIVSMAREAFQAYSAHAWADESLRPVTCEPYNQWFGQGSGRTIVASLSTLWLLGLRREFEVARKWVETKLELRPEQIGHQVSLHFAVGEYVGGLLSAYALTGDWMFVHKARQVADALLPAYHNETGLLYHNLNLTYPTSTSVFEYNMFLWNAVQNLEYHYLSKLTANPEYRNRVLEARKVLHKIVHSPEAFNNAETNYLLQFGKILAQSNGNDHDAEQLYSKAVELLMQNAIGQQNGLIYVKDYDYGRGRRGQWMDADSCALNSAILWAWRTKRQMLWREGGDEQRRTIELAQLEKQWNLAVQLTDTCHQAEVRSKTGLAPARFYFTNADVATNEHGDQNLKQAFLNPEIAENFFLMYRLTNDHKYRDYAWAMALAIHAHCRVAQTGGYSIIGNVDQIPTVKSSPTSVSPQLLDPMTTDSSPLDPLNHQPTYFLGATLKYLYLIFTDDSTLPLDKWVFNDVGQPLPIG